MRKNILHPPWRKIQRWQYKEWTKHHKEKYGTKKNKKQNIKENKKTRIHNRRLCKKYPWLIPRNRFTGKISWVHYPYDSTELDDMPKGWRIAFGDIWCEEIQKILVKNHSVNEFRIIQLKEKFGCYDDQTEVLTKDGWKYFKDLSFEDEIATLDNNDYLMYQKPEDIIASKYNGDMYHLENRGISLVVTPNHNLYVAKGSYFYHDKNNLKMQYPFELVYPEKYFGKDKRFKKDCFWKGTKPNPKYKIKGLEYENYMVLWNKNRHYINDNLEFDIIPFLHFLGFYIAEGCVTLKKDGHPREINIAYNPFDEEVLVNKLIVDLGFNVFEGGYGCKRIYNNSLAGWLLKECGHLAPNKKVPNFIKDLPPKYIEEFLKYLFIGDGHKSKTANILTTTSKQLSNDVQELLLKCGYTFRETIRDRRGVHGKINGREINTKCINYEINWLRLGEIEIDNSKVKKTKSFIEQWEPYNGVVYCVTVPNHIIYIRRNGKGCWCGNSFRQYTNGYPKEMSDLIWAFEIISEYVCVRCGKLHSPIINNYGWYEPLCRDCYEKQDYKTVTYDERLKEAEIETIDDMMIPTSFTLSTWSKDKGDQERTVDISWLVNKIIYKNRKRRTNIEQTSS